MKHKIENLENMLIIDGFQDTNQNGYTNFYFKPLTSLNNNTSRISSIIYNIRILCSFSNKPTRNQRYSEIDWNFHDSGFIFSS